MRARARDPQRTEEPSKSQRKREMLALQALGESLLPLEDERLERLPVTAELIDAVRTARAIRAHEARRRQLQYIGRLMREIDAPALRDALADETREHRVATAVMHAAERWRERVLADDRALGDWLAKYPDTRESLEPLVPRARSELATGRPGRAFRALFRTLRDRLG